MRPVTLEDRPKRFLSDDPSFVASLSDLDLGLANGRRATAEGEARATVRPEGDSARAAASTAPSASPPPALRASRGPRPLLDLFPAPDEGHPAPPQPAVAPRRLELTTPVVTGTYETFYGFSEPPFSLSSDPKHLYHSVAHDRAAQAVLGAIWRREGVVVLTGPPGVGKTMLCRGVIEQLDRRTLTSLVAEPFASVDDLLRTMLIDFGVISRADLAAGRLRRATRTELTKALRDFLLSLARLQAFAVVIIDQAHNLPVDQLDEIRVLAEASGTERLLQVLLVGQPALLGTLASSKLRQLAKRVSLRTTLEPLSREEIDGYIGHRLTLAGDRPRVEFDQRAIARIYEISLGVPRVVNLLCDGALAQGYERSASVIDERFVQAAADDLDLAPPLSSAAIAARLAAAIAALLLLVVLGATAAALVLRSDVRALILQWQNLPPLPGPPPGAVPPPIAPAPPTPISDRQLGNSVAPGRAGSGVRNRARPFARRPPERGAFDLTT